MNIPALDDAKDHIVQDNPFADAELVIYTSDTEYASQEPTHSNLQELDLVSFSLWARWESEGVEIPILGEASWHIWYSLSAEVFQPDAAEPVSDAFVAAMAEWASGDPERDETPITAENWDSMRPVEQYIFHLTADGVTMDNPEPNLIVDWCLQRAREDTDA